ncbi:MAG: SCO2322 family protein [Candidatus Nanopelagicales bacterium]
MITKVVAGISTMACAAVVLIPVPAHAATYRYWSYWTGGDQWSYSGRGPAFRVPADASVEGWRFVVSPRDGSQATAPTEASSYDQLCPGQPAAAAGQKRVAVVIDFGPAGIAPVGETPPATSTSCVTVPTSATGLQVLQKVAKLRFNASGLICGIAGFPATECPGQTAGAVTETSATPTRTTQPVAPDPVTVPAPDTQLTHAPRTTSQSPTPTPSLTTPRSSSGAPSAIALAADQPPASAQGTTAPPAWVAAIGAALIAALLGMAVLMRRGRE